MDILAKLKAAAAAKIGAVDSDVQAYLGALEARINATKKLLIGSLVLGAAVGAIAARLV